MNRKALILCLIILPTLVNAQRWKRQRYEWVTGIGATQFLGDVGGRNQIGSDWFFDLDAPSTRYMINAGLRYKISPYISVKGGLSVGEVYGNDEYTKEPYRNNRNIHFRSPVVELSGQIEASWMREQIGSRYKIRRVRGRGRRGSRVYVYGFAGVGLLYMNPMAKSRIDGKWRSLRQFNTEGQTIIPTRERYSNFQFVIPFGIGMKYKVDKRSSIGIEYGLRKTFTDYMDDVSLTYFYAQNGDGGFIQQQYGIDDIAADYADPSLLPIAPDAEWQGGCSTCPGQQRGDPTDLDSYMFMMITYQRTIRTSRKGLPKF